MDPDSDNTKQQEKNSTEPTQDQILASIPEQIQLSLVEPIQEPILVNKEKEQMITPSYVETSTGNQETQETEPKKHKRTVAKKKKKPTKPKKRKNKKLDEEEEEPPKIKRTEYNGLDDLHRSSHLLDKEYYRRPPSPPPVHYPMELPEWRYDPWEVRRRLYSSRF